MKHALFMVVYTLYFTVRGFADPFLALIPYYTWAVLRPQATWKWSLPQGIRWSLYAAILGMLVVLLNFRMCSFRNVKKGFLKILLAFACLVFLSYGFAMDMEIAGRVLEEYLKILLMMAVACYAISKPKHHRYLAMVILIPLSYLIFNVNQLYLWHNRLDIYHNGYGGLDNNGAALMLAMAIPFMYFLFMAERRFWRWGYLALTLPAAHAIMLTYSRGAMLSAVVTAVPMVLIGSKKKIRSVVVMVLIGMVVLSLAGNEVRDRFSTISESESDASAQSRFTSWRAGYEIAKDNPMVGVGLRNSPLIIRSYGIGDFAPVVHNLYIQVAADTGFPAAVALLLMMAYALVGFWKASRRAGRQMDDKEMRWHHAVCQAGFWSMFLYCFGSLFLSTELFELPYLLMAMGATAQGVLQEQETQDSQTDSVPDQHSRSPVPSPA
jgi:probable O-glycosylation ligase (exosortase A-associated)